MAQIIKLHRATIALPDGTFIAQIQMTDGRVLADAEHPFPTRDDAESREVQLAETLKRLQGRPHAVIEFCS
jgi:hypothetical protein